MESGDFGKSALAAVSGKTKRILCITIWASGKNKHFLVDVTLTVRNRLQGLLWSLFCSCQLLWFHSTLDQFKKKMFGLLVDWKQ